MGLIQRDTEMTAIVLSPSACSTETKATYSLRPPKGLALALLIAAGTICPLIATSSQAAPACRYTCNSNVPARPAGYSPGFNAGYDRGYAAGYAAGRHQYAADYNAGYNYGFSAGYSNGYAANKPPYRPVRY